MNNLLRYSPDQVGFKSDRDLSLCARNSPCVRLKEQERLSVAVTTCVQSVCSSAPGENLGDHAGKDGGFETCSM